LLNRRFEIVSLVLREKSGVRPPIGLTFVDESVKRLAEAFVTRLCAFSRS